MGRGGVDDTGHRTDAVAHIAGVLVVFFVFTVVMVVTLSLKSVGEQGVRTERDLQEVVSELHRQDALEWRVISGRVAPQDAVVELSQSRRRARVLTVRAGSSAAREGTTRSEESLAGVQERYSAAVDEELRLLGAGRTQEAEELDEAEVDPAFDAAMDVLHEDSVAASMAAVRAQWLSNAGIVITVGLALALTALLESRRRQARVQREVERRSEARYRALVDRSSDLVLVTDRDGVVGYLSPSAQRLLPVTGVDVGVNMGAGAALNLLMLVHEEDRAALRSALQQVDPQHGAALDVRVRINSTMRTLAVSVQDLTTDPAVLGLVLTCHDLTERHQLQQQLEHRALHDTLTGLPNRALLADRFAQALRSEARSGSPTALLLIDLDRFKEINDTLGHHHGDELLIQIGPRLSAVLRASDTIARLGGDEFAVLLAGVGSLETAVTIAYELQEVLTHPFEVEGVTLDVEASIGIALSGTHGSDPATLMRRADVAMYTAKQHGMGVAVYDPSSDGHSPERLALLGDLRRALSNEELSLQYQPKISLGTGEVCGAEALVRWQHPQRGAIAPDDFIPLAENTGLIGPLTTRVLELALAQTRRWAEVGAPLQVAVNLSARNLLDERLDRQVAELLTRHGVAPALLKLEVTESAIMLDPARAKAVLQRLHALGVQLSIDDFGAGYTSLAYLKDLPVSELKVDRSFVMTMQTDTSNAMIVRSVIELGHNLGLSAVAEGVEDAAALKALVDYACDVAQGYHVSRPLSAAAFDHWRVTWSGLPDRGGLPDQHTIAESRVRPAPTA